MLGEAIVPTALEGMDAIIHAAHDFSPGGSERNLAGTRDIYSAAKRLCSPKQIFLSSYSARADAVAEYGRIKYELEQYFLSEGQTIVRPGLVIGDGGLFGRNLRKMLRSPVIPLLDGGSDLLPVIGIQDFAAAMTVIVESSEPGAYNLFYESLTSLRTLIEMLKRKARHRALLVNVPASWALPLLGAAKKLGIPFPVGADQVKSLKLNQQCVHRSDLKVLLPSHSSLDDALEAALLSARSTSD